MNMAQMILHGRELIRINTQKNYIEYSTNDGRSWHTRYTGTHAGNFIDLIDYGSEIIACTSKGIFLLLMVEVIGIADILEILLVLSFR